MSIRRIASVLFFFFVSFNRLAAGQTCGPTNTAYVTSFTVSPSTIVGDGHHFASASYSTSSPLVGNVPVNMTPSLSVQCLVPSFFESGPYEWGCASVNSSANMYLSGTVSTDTTFTIHADVPYPYNGPTCGDPGQDISITLTAPPSEPPVDPTTPDLPCKDCAFAGAPINVTNGDTWITEQDYSLPGLGGGLSLTRTWNSMWPTVSPVEQAGTFGDSWRSTYNERLQSLTGGVTKYWQANGNAWFFTYDSINNVYNLTSPLQEHASLTFDSVASQYTLTLVDGTKKLFNSSGYLTAIVDRNGNQVTVSYDTSNRITQVTDAASRSITFTYGDPSNPNQATSVQDATGTIASYTYDSSSRLTRVTYADSSQINFAYDSNSLITNVTDGAGKVFETHTYDSLRRGTYSARATVGGVATDAVTLGYGYSPYKTFVWTVYGTTQYYWTVAGGRRFVTEANGQGCATCGLKTMDQQYFNYLSDGSVASSQMDGYNPMFYTYDANGNVTSKTTSTNYYTTMTWNYSYNSFGELLTSTDPNGNTTTNTYDANGNLLTTTTPSPDGGTTPGSVTTFTYNSNGTLSTITDPLSNVTTLAYFSNGLIQYIQDAQSHRTTYAYDARGNRTSSTDANSKVTGFTYDVMNRLTKITYPDTTTVQFGYDYRGRRTSVTDQNSKVTQYAYDDADHLISVTDAQTPTAGVTQYAYDGENNVTSITDALDHQTTMQYDNGGQVTQVTYPSGYYESFVYQAGQVETRVDRKGQRFWYYTDGSAVLRPVQTSNPDSSLVNYTWDGAGNLTQVTDPSGTYSFNYDHMNRLTSTVVSYSFLGARTFTTSYTYDAAGNRLTMTDPEGGVTHYTYDTLNRLSNLEDFQSNNYGFGYDVLSRRTSLTRPNSVNTTYAYDDLSHLLSVLHKNGSTTLDGASYTYDNAGNRTAKTDQYASVTSSYTYDNIYQLTGVTQGTSTTESYSYDLVGNRLGSLSVSPYTYNSSNEMATDPVGSYTYDANGNMLTKPDGTAYTWDVNNRLTQVTLPGTGGTVTFKYDPFGRRAQKAFTVSGTTTTTNYVYDGSTLLEETDQSGSVLARFTQSPAADEPLAQVSSGTTNYYEQDGVGSVTSLSSGTGVLLNTYKYDSYGQPTTSTGSLPNSFRYTGREFDAEIGLYNYRARLYDQNVGRFISEDPIGLNGGINLYGYVSNNPVVLVDPTGLAPQSTSTGGDLLSWLLGESLPTSYHSDDSVTAALAGSTAMTDIQNQFAKANCQDGKYCGEFPLHKVPFSFSLTVQAVGSFCAYLQNTGNGEVQVDAFNDWGLRSLTHIPYTNRSNPSLQNMLLNGANWSIPSSLLNNTDSGWMSTKRFWYHWTEKSPCCGK
jgi:RHS repeat-associated protein